MDVSLKKYTFKSLGMLGEMYVGEEEAGIREGEFYRAEDVVALINKWHHALNLAYTDGDWEAMDNVMAEMEDAAKSE